MGRPINVDTIDDFIPIQTVFATATDKSGLVSNKVLDKDGKPTGNHLEGVPDNGIIGYLFDANPDAVVISTGGTAKLIGNAGYKVVEISDFTGWAEMETGLVKSMHPKLYVGMLAHPHTPSDAAYMAEHNLDPVDLVLVNFYAFEKTAVEHPLQENPRNFEILRQAMDVGGPTSAHTSRKGFLTTAVTTRPEDYTLFTCDMMGNDGAIGVDARLVGMKHTSQDLTDYFVAMNNVIQQVDSKRLRAAYNIVNEQTRGD